MPSGPCRALRALIYGRSWSLLLSALARLLQEAIPRPGAREENLDFYSTYDVGPNT